jgi:hypothetical protein
VRKAAIMNTFYLLVFGCPDIERFIYKGIEYIGKAVSATKVVAIA